MLSHVICGGREGGHGQWVTIKTISPSALTLSNDTCTWNWAVADYWDRLAYTCHDPAVVQCSAEYNQSMDSSCTVVNRVSWGGRLVHAGTSCPITGRNHVKDSRELADHGFVSRLWFGLKNITPQSVISSVSTFLKSIGQPVRKAPMKWQDMFKPNLLQWLWHYRVTLTSCLTLIMDIVSVLTTDACVKTTTKD